MKSAESFFTTSCLIASVILLVLYLIVYKKLNYWRDCGVPFIRPLRSLMVYVLCLKNINEIYEDIYKELSGNRFGGYYELLQPVLMIRDPELIHRILIKDFKHFYDRSFYNDHEHDPIASNLFRLKGETWRILRNKLTPTFSTGKLKGMFDQICKCGDKLTEYIEEESKFGKPLNGEPLIINFAFDVIGTCAFGLQLNGEKKVRRKFQLMVHKSCSRSKRQIFLFLFLYYAPRVAKRLGFKLLSKDLMKFFQDLVKEALAYREKNNTIRNDFLQLLLDLKNQEKSGKVQFPTDEDDPDDQIIDQMEYATKLFNDTSNTGFITDSIITAQCLSFLSAGSETVSVTLTFSLYCLSQNPQVQEMLYNEIDSILTSHGHEWSYGAVKEMKYLDQVLQETTRMYPAMPTLYRACTEHYKMPGTNVVIRKGTAVIIPIRAVQNDPKNYESPETFDPSRFEGNNYKPSPTFFPFGDGPRICIAMRFVILELKIVLAKIISQYTVKLSGVTKLPLKYSPSSYHLKPEEGMWFEFHKRLKL